MPLDKQGFYDAIAIAVGRPLKDIEQELLDIACAADPHVLRGFEEGWVKTLKGRVPEFIPLTEAEARFAEKKIGRWLYDKRSKVWIINLDKGVHELLAGTLYGIYLNDPDISRETAAERYLEEHYGFWVSGAMNLALPIKADSYTLAPEEAIFEQAKGRLAWRGI